MILSELNRLLVNVARSNYLVNEAFVGDVYSINSKENRFGCFVATPMTAVKSSGIIRYNYVLYYIDRLTKDEVNIDDVQSDAVSVLKGIIEFLGENGAEIETGYEFTLFRHQFSDWCAGAYVSVRFVVADNDCNEGEFNISGNELIPLVIDKNGIYTPGTGYDGYNRITVNVPQVGATEEWVDDEIDTKLTGYATQTWVNSQGFLKTHQDLSDYATINWVNYTIDNNDQNPCVRAESLESYLEILGYAKEQWVENQGYIKTSDLTNYATKTWVNNQGFLKDCDLDGLATETYVNSQGFLKDDDLDGLATETYVNSQGFIKTADLSGYATETYVNSQGFIKISDLTGYATEDFVERQGFLVPSDLDDYATKSWVNNQDFLTEGAIDGLASETWVRNQGYLVGSDLNNYATRAWTISQGYITDSALCDYATKDWVNSQDYLTEDDLCGYATETWVKNWVTAQEYLRQCDLDGYATENWVERQGYLKEDDISSIFATKLWVEEKLEDYGTIEYIENNYVSNTTIEDYVKTEDLEQELDDYATKDWTNSQGFLKDLDGLVWSGTEEEWYQLSPSEQCSYLISLIVEE